MNNRQNNNIYHQQKIYQLVLLSQLSKNTIQYTKQIPKMLTSSNKHLIVFSAQQKQCYINYVINSAKISFSQLSNFKKFKQDTVRRCINYKCTVLYHAKDQQWLWTKDQYLKNYELLDKKAKLPKDLVEDKNIKDIRIWICRFCGQHQKVDIKKHSFMTHPICFKVQENQQQQKNPQPIILFLIDWSSSMQELVLSNEKICKDGMNKDRDKQKKIFENKNKQTLDLIKQSDMVNELMKLQAQVFENAEMIAGSKNKKPNYTNICRNHLLLAIVQRVFKEIKSQLSNSKTQVDRKFGFLFFNDILFLTGSCNSQMALSVPSDRSLSVENTLSKHSQSKLKHSIKQVDYRNFDSLFDFGVSQAHKYNDFLVKTDIKKMKFVDIEPQGQTSLGPAIAVALGIVSKHGQGSNIVVITDGLANQGILSSYNNDIKDTNENVQKIKNSLNKHKCKLGILQWKQKNNSNQNYLDLLVKAQPNLVTKYQVNLDMESQKIKNNSKNVIDLAYRQRIQNQIVDVKFKHNVDFIKFQRSRQQQVKPHQQKDYLELVTSKSTLWFDIIIDQNKIDPFYFAKNPIYTQVLITMRNIDDKELSCYVTEIEQYITKNKYKTLDELKYDLAQQRIDRLHIEGNSFKFNQKQMENVNKSISMRNNTIGRNNFDISYDDNDMYQKAIEHGLSYKSKVIFHFDD